MIGLEHQFAGVAAGVDRTINFEDGGREIRGILSLSTNCRGVVEQVGSDVAYGEKRLVCRETRHGDYHVGVRDVTGVGAAVVAVTQEVGRVGVGGRIAAHGTVASAAGRGIRRE